LKKISLNPFSNLVRESLKDSKAEIILNERSFKNLPKMWNVPPGFETAEEDGSDHQMRHHRFLQEGIKPEGPP
jgi:hypothetical protein